MFATIPKLANIQKGGNILCFCPMQKIDTDSLIRENLRRLIDHYDGGNQSAFARRFDLKASFINGVLAGDRTLGKGIIEAICEKLKIEPAEFFRTDKTPIATSEQEELAIFQMREAVELGIAGQIEAVTKAIIEEAKKKGGSGGKSASKGVPRRSRKAS